MKTKRLTIILLSVLIALSFMPGYAFAEGDSFDVNDQNLTETTEGVEARESKETVEEADVVQEDPANTTEDEASDVTKGNTSGTRDGAKIVASGTCDMDITWTLDSDGLLTISGTKMGSFNNEYYRSPWRLNNDIVSVVIDDGVTNIGSYVFTGCKNLRSITIPDSVTSIGNYAFWSCSSLTGITIPDSVTSIGVGAFSGCSSLTSITIPDGVTSIGGAAFSDCSSMTSITIPDGVTSFESYAFSGCRSLTSITIPEEMTSIGANTFSGCSGLTSITIPEGVTSIGNSAFRGCSGLTSIEIPDGVTSIGSYAFSGCNGLTSITIPEGVTSIGQGVFQNCSGMTSITIPEGVTSIGYYAFSGCSSLKSVTIPASVTSFADSSFDSNQTRYIFYGGTKEQWKLLRNAPNGIVHYCSTGHNWSEDFIVDVEPTCTKEGSKSKHCTVSNCDAKSEVTVIDALGHDWNEGTITIKPTCTEDGIKTLACQRCNETKTEVIDAKGHSFSEEYTVDKEPTCTKEGVESIRCSVCGEIKESRAIPSLGYEEHDWGKWEFDENTKTHARACSRCEEKETQACTFDEGVVTQEPTVTEVGEKLYTCNICKGTYTEAIPEAGYMLKVIDGSSVLEQRYLEGEIVTISAADETEYKKLTKWEVTSGNLTLSSTEINADPLVFAMPSSDVSIKAVYTGQSLEEDIDKENKRHKGVVSRASILESNIEVYTDTANRIKNKYGVGYLQPSTYYANQASSTQATITQKQNRLNALRANTAGGNQVEIKQLEAEIASLQSDYQMYLELKMAAQYLEQANELQKERNTINLTAEETKHQNNITTICANHGVKNQSVKEIKYIRLDKDEYAYTGKEIHPIVSVYDTDGNKLGSESYSVEYPSDCTSVGSHVLTLNLKGDYVGTKQKAFAIVRHEYGDWIVIKKETCSQDGSRQRICSICGKSEYEIIPASHDWDTPEWTWSKDHTSASAVFTCKNDAAHVETVDAEVTSALDETGDNIVYTAKIVIGGKEYTDTVTVENEAANDERLYGKARYDTAIAAAEKYKGTEDAKFKNVIVAYGKNFPDALSGGYLAKVKNAPILLVEPSVEGKIVDYISKNISSGGKVYILGGTGAVSSGFESKVNEKGIKTERLGGASRYETNLLILKAAGVTDEDILVCTGTGYADSLSASAVGKPILLVGNTLTDDQKKYVKGLNTKQFYLIGGNGAVNPAIEKGLKDLGYSNVERIFGASRYETSTAVAKKFFPKAKTVILAYAMNFPDGLSGGPLAMKKNAPIVLTDSNKFDAAKMYVKESGAVRSITLGGPALVSEIAVKAIMGR